MTLTKIEWADATWGPVTGCTKVSAGCDHCYAIPATHRFASSNKKFEGLTEHKAGGVQWTNQVKTHPDVLDEPLRRKKPTRYFVNSMSDLFHPDVPFEFIDCVFAVMALSPQHTFQILTKRPERMRAYLTAKAPAGWSRRAWVAEAARQIALREQEGSPRSTLGRDVVHVGDIAHLRVWPLPNVWFGVSVEDQRTADQRIPVLLQCPAAIRWVSYEPALGPVDFNTWLPPLFFKKTYTAPYLSWIVAGGESGPGARPSDPDWFRQVRDDCVQADVPFFFKQWGEWKEWDFDLDWHPNDDGIRSHLFPEPRGEYGEGEVVYRIGKKRAGRRLDGVEWNQFPGDL